MGDNATAGLLPALLKFWRGRRGMSQLDLAHTASVSPRHVSFLETGRSRPSREMLLRLATAMSLPLRAKNEMLAAAGYPPAFDQTPIEDDALDFGVRTALDLMLERHEPFPVFVMDGRFDIVRTNRSAQRFFELICADPAALGDTPNGYHIFLRPDLGRPSLCDWPDVAALLVGLLHRKVLQSPDNRALGELLDEILGFPNVAECGRTPDLGTPATSVFTFRFESANFTGTFLSTLTTFVAPTNVALEELSIESYYPLDEPTVRACHRTLDVPG
jgi:transcriptional regulator with XRE-family HTH domain